jgi:acyl-CoA synthetase (NDP forming)
MRARGALWHLAACAEWRPGAGRPDAAATSVAGPLLLKAGALNEAEAKQAFAAFGIAGVREVIAATAADAAHAAAQFGGNVVLKILSREIAHKSEIGGVRVNLPRESVAAACAEMAAAVKAASKIEPEGFLVQEMVKGGTELILGFHRDPQLGPAMLLGMGGVAAEVMQDTTLRLLPISRADAEAMVRELKGFPLLDGYRGRPPSDIDALVAAILAFANMAAILGERLEEAEINPLFVLPRGQGVRAADGLMLLGG